MSLWTINFTITFSSWRCKHLLRLRCQTQVPPSILEHFWWDFSLKKKFLFNNYEHSHSPWCYCLATFSNVVLLIICCALAISEMNLWKFAFTFEHFLLSFLQCFWIVASRMALFTYNQYVADIFCLVYYRHLSRTSRMACNIWFAVKNFSIRNESSEVHASRVSKVYDIANTRFWAFIERAASIDVMNWTRPHLAIAKIVRHYSCVWITTARTAI